MFLDKSLGVYLREVGVYTPLFPPWIHHSFLSNNDNTNNNFIYFKDGSPFSSADLQGAVNLQPKN